jgi:hypothetical protein
MASRKWINHVESSFSPEGERLGDEWFDKGANRLYKRLAVNGTVVTEVEIPTLISGNLLVSGGTVNDQAGNVRNLINSSKTTAYTLNLLDNGRMINTATGGVTVPANIFLAGNNVTIYNDSSSDQTITQGAGVTMYLAGTATTGNRTLAQRGLCTVICVGINTFAISGAGLT